VGLIISHDSRLKRLADAGSSDNGARPQERMLMHGYLQGAATIKTKIVQAGTAVHGSRAASQFQRGGVADLDRFGRRMWMSAAVPEPPVWGLRFIRCCSTRMRCKNCQ
jgi:hypothetical protein